jgi:quercetin dioxygenase-like cupin family protein
VNVTHFKEAKLEPQVRAMFTGEVHSAVRGDAPSAHLHLNLVKFSPGGRTKWHIHPFDQSLIIVEGKGIVATEEHEHVVETGDVVIIPTGEKHWHGGTNTSGMAHIAINGDGEATILDPVEQIRTPNV